MQDLSSKELYLGNHNLLKQGKCRVIGRVREDAKDGKESQKKVFGKGRGSGYQGPSSLPTWESPRSKSKKKLSMTPYPLGDNKTPKQEKKTRPKVA